MRLRPSEILYSQDSIGNTFNNRCQHRSKKIGETLDDICEGSCSIDSIPTIQVAIVSGKWRTSDNRRLWVFRQLERLGKCNDIPVRNIGRIPSNKLTSRNGGQNIRVRGDGPGGQWHRRSESCSFGLQPDVRRQAVGTLQEARQSIDIFMTHQQLPANMTVQQSQSNEDVNSGNPMLAWQPIFEGQSTTTRGHVYREPRQESSKTSLTSYKGNRENVQIFESSRPTIRERVYGGTRSESSQAAFTSYAENIANTNNRDRSTLETPFSSSRASSCATQLHSRDKRLKQSTQSNMQRINNESIRRNYQDDKSVRRINPGDQPDRQSYPDDQPVRRSYPDDQPVRRSYPDDQPVTRSYPDDQPVTRIYPDDQPVRRSNPGDQPDRRSNLGDQPVRRSNLGDQPVRRSNHGDQPDLLHQQVRGSYLGNQPVRRSNLDDQSVRRSNLGDQPVRRSNFGDQPDRRSNRGDQHDRRSNLDDQPVRRSYPDEQADRRSNRGDQPVRQSNPCGQPVLRSILRRSHTGEPLGQSTINRVYAEVNQSCGGHTQYQRLQESYSHEYGYDSVQAWQTNSTNRSTHHYDAIRRYMGYRPKDTSSTNWDNNMFRTYSPSP